MCGVAPACRKAGRSLVIAAYLEWSFLLYVWGLGISPACRRQGRPRERDFAKLNLHLNIFDQPSVI